MLTSVAEITSQLVSENLVLNRSYLPSSYFQIQQVTDFLALFADTVYRAVIANVLMKKGLCYSTINYYNYCYKHENIYGECK